MGFRLKSIQQRFTFGLAAVIGTILIIFSFILIGYNSNSLENKLHVRLDNLVELSGKSLSSTLWQYNYEYVNDYIDSLFVYEDLAFASVSTAGKTLKKKSRQDFIGKNIAFFKDSPKFITKEASIMHREIVVGKVFLALSRERIDSLIVNNSIFAISLLCLIISAIFITNYILSKKFLFQPLANLENSVRLIAGGNLNARIDTSRKDEIGKLAQTFRQMMQSIKTITTSRDELNHEIFERKQAEETLKARESFLDRVIDQSPFATWISDAEGTLQRANPALKRFLNLTDEQLVGKYNVLKDKIAERKGLQPLFRTVFEEGKTVTFSMEWDGNDIPTMDLRGSNSVSIEATMFPIHNPKGELTNVVLIWIEITDRKRAEEELKEHRDHLEELVEKRTEELKEKTGKTEESRKALTYLVEDVNNAREDLEKANRDISAVNQELQDFAYIVSHDLKAPLRAVSQLAYWISEDYAEVLDEDGKEHLKLLSGRVKRMDGLINGILQYSRLGRAKEKQDKIDLAKTLPSVIETLSPPENIRITIEDELPEIVGNKTHMEQVFQNLMGNAIKFMDKPEGLITIGCRDEGSHWEFRITDNGPGIQEKYYERIFKIFQTLVPRDEHESTGIGLTLVKKTIEQYDGKVWVESEVGKGSSFVFKLPKKKA